MPAARREVGKTVMANFDSIDIFYLANTLSLPQLRGEIHWAEHRAFLIGYFDGTPYQCPDDYYFPWADYAKCCREVVKWQRQNKPQSTPARGKIDVDTIKAKSDIVTVIENYTELRKSGKNFTGRCPIHQDKHPSMTVYPDQQSWHCFGCNRGGDVIAFIMAVENTDFRGATTILGGR